MDKMVCTSNYVDIGVDVFIHIFFNNIIFNTFFNIIIFQFFYILIYIYAN
jgi:hypothetical protein